MWDGLSHFGQVTLSQVMHEKVSELMSITAAKSHFVQFLMKSVTEDET